MKYQGYEEFYFWQGSFPTKELVLTTDLKWKGYSVTNRPMGSGVDLKFDVVTLKNAEPLLFAVSGEIAIHCLLESKGLVIKDNGRKAEELPDGPISEFAKKLMSNPGVADLVKRMALHLTLIEERSSEVPTKEQDEERPITVYITGAVSSNYKLDVIKMEIKKYIPIPEDSLYMIVDLSCQISDLRLQKR